MPYLYSTPYTPAPYAEMMEHKRFPFPMTEAGYAASINRLMKAAEGVVMHDIAYLSDGLKVTGVEVLPDFAAGEKGPLILYNRGGSGEYGALTPAQVGFFMVPLALEMRGGVLATNYRGNSGGEGQDEFGGAEVEDVLRLITLGQQQPWWDGKNIFLIGWSRGGMMAYLASKAGAPLTAMVSGAAPTDWAGNTVVLPRMEELFERRVPDYHANREALLSARSAMYWPEAITTPTLIMHGAKDERIDVEDARRLYAALKALGRDVKYVEFPEGDHFMAAHRQSIIEHTVAWFDAHRVA